MLSQELIPNLQQAGFEVVNEGLPELDITQSDRVRLRLHAVQPQIVINAAGYTAVDQAESKRELAFAVNRDGPKHLAKTCRRLGMPLVHVSTDYVFDGTSKCPYREDDNAEPLGIYGKSKWEGEEVIRSVHAEHMIVRTAWLYSVHGHNFLKTILRLAGERKELQVIDDQYGCPTWAKELAVALTKICHRIRMDGHSSPWGSYHFCGRGKATWFGLACMAIQEAKRYATLRIEQVLPISTEAYGAPARRPAYSVLDCSKISRVFGVHPSEWVTSVGHCVREIYS